MRFEVDCVLGWDGDEENVVNFMFSPWTFVPFGGYSYDEKQNDKLLEDPCTLSTIGELCCR